MLVEVLLLAVMVGTALPAWRGERAAAAFLALEGAAWLIVDKGFEGPHLYYFAHGHGLVLADLVGLGALVGAAVCLLRSREPDRTR
jgi:hypothetical protein